MKWFPASLLFRSVHQVPDEDGIWEESIRLIQAGTRELCQKKAEAIGNKEKVSYIAVSGNKVTWEFVQVERVYEILDDDLGDSTEVFSRFLRDSEVKSLLTQFED